MNELILNVDGTVTVVGDAGSVEGIIAELAGTSDPETVAVEISAQELKTHPWRLPVARTNALQRIRGLRDVRLLVLDREANHSATGRPGQRPPPLIENDRQTLRDLPPVAEAHLAALNNTDDMDAYVPDELA